MPAFCKSVSEDQSDHVWRWRNEQAGYFRFARRPWQEALRRKQACFNINSLDPSKQYRGSCIDDNREAIRNGDTAIY